MNTATFPKIGVKRGIEVNGQYVNNDGRLGPKEHAILFWKEKNARKFAKSCGYTVPEK